jgi:hypothetical protein
MLKRGRQELTEGEKKELLYSGIIPRFADKGHWYSKEEVIKTIADWDLYSNYINVCLIEWDADKGSWDIEDDVPSKDYGFDLYKGRDLDQLVGTLFQASIDGYTIRYVSRDCLTGLFLERTRDVRTNIDEDVLNALVELIRDRWERDD